MKNFLKTSPQSSTKTEHAPQRSKVKERLPQQQKTRDDIAKSLISLKKKRDKALRKSGDLEKILLMDDYNKKVDDIRTTENYKFAQEGWKGKLEELYSSNLEEFSDFLRNILGYMSEEDQKTIFWALLRGLERAYKYGYYAKDLEGKDQKDGFYSELRGRKFVDPLFDKLFSKLKGTNPTAFMSYLADSMGNSIFNQYCLQKHFSQLDSDGMAKVRNFYLKRFSNGVYSPFNWNEMDPIEQKKIITFLSQQKQKDDLAKLMLLDVGRYDIFTKEEVVDLIYNSSVIFAYSWLSHSTFKDVIISNLWRIPQSSLVDIVVALLSRGHAKKVVENLWKLSWKQLPEKIGVELAQKWYIEEVRIYKHLFTLPSTPKSSSSDISSMSF